MAEISEQIVREAPEIEAIKLGLLKSAKTLADTRVTLPEYQIAGLNPQQIDALVSGVSGIGSYIPYMEGASTAATAGAGTLAEGVDVLRGLDSSGQFNLAQQALTSAGTPITRIGELTSLAGQGVPLLQQGAAGLSTAQQMAGGFTQANLGPSQQLMLDAALAAQQAGPQFGEAQQRIGGGAELGYDAALAARQAALEPGFGTAEAALGQGIGALGGAAQRFAPGNVQEFMNPYQQQVIDESLRQINRQGDIARQNLQAQAVRSGAFGGSREGIQRAELERALSEQRNAAIVGGLSQGYQGAAAQAQQAFEQQQQRQLAQAQGFQGVAGQAGALSAQQAGLGMQAAQQLGQAGQMGMQAGAQLGSLEAQRAQQALAAAQYGGGIGQQLGAQQLQQAGLGQAAAGLYGNLAQQEAALAGQFGNIASQQAAILGQQAQLGQAQAAGIGSLAQQEFNIGAQTAAGLGSLGSQLSGVGLQQAQLGGMEQQLGQQDTTFLYGLGQQQQSQQQRELDALRASEMQRLYEPYQRLAYLSDIYKGAPSTQMAVTTQTAPTPSPFQQVAGLATGALATAGAVKAAGNLF